MWFKYSLTNAGRWLIEAFNGNSSEFWEANWEVGDQDDPERKIWKVIYYRIAENHKPMIHQHNSRDWMPGMKMAGKYCLNLKVSEMNE